MARNAAKLKQKSLRINMPKIHYNAEDTYLAKPVGFREKKDRKEQKRDRNNIKYFPKHYDPEEGLGSFGHTTIKIGTIGAQKDKVSEAAPKDTQKRKDISGPSTVSGSAKKKTAASKSGTKDAGALNVPGKSKTIPSKTQNEVKGGKNIPHNGDKP